MEGDELSAEEPGYVPPDHKTTAEFRIPRKSSAAGPSMDAAESTVVDTPFDPEDTITDDPVPVDTIGGGPETVTDFPVDSVDDLPSDDLPVDDLPVGNRVAVPVDDVAEPVDDAEPGEWTAFFGQEEPPGRGDPTAPHPGLAGRGGQMPLPMAAAAHVPPRAPSGPEGPTGPAGPPPPVQAPPVQAPPPQVPAQHAQGAPPPGPPENAATQPAGARPVQPPLVPPPGGMAPPHPPTQPAGMAQGPVPPPYAPVGSPAPPIPPGRPPAGAPARRNRGPLVVVAAVVLGIALLGGGLAVALRSGDDDTKKKTTGAGTVSPAASVSPGGGSPSPGTTQPGVPPGSTASPDITSGPGQTSSPGVTPPPTTPIGPVVQGRNLTYQLVQQDPGYYEGLLIVTNRSSKPMKGWKLTFDAPKSNVKQVWGGELVKGGDKIEIRDLDGAPPIPPGATYEIRFGAQGSAVTPKGCEFNNKPCGFT